MGERGGLPIKEIPALVLDVAREMGWIDKREAESLRSALTAAEQRAAQAELRLAECLPALKVSSGPWAGRAAMTRGDAALPDAIDRLVQERDAAREENARLKEIVSFDGVSRTFTSIKAERDARQELLVDIARDLDLLGHDLASIPGAVRSALSAAREEARAAAERSNRQSEIISAISEALGNRLAPSALALAKSVAAERDAAREEARREREQADVWQSQLHDTAAALYLAKEEARRLKDCGHPDETLECDCQRHLVRAHHRAESSARRLRGALEALVLRLDAVHAHPSYQGVWSIAQMHWGPYSGPTYVDALAAARAALGSSPVSPSSREGGDDGR